MKENRLKRVRTAFLVLFVMYGCTKNLSCDYINGNAGYGKPSDKVLISLAPNVGFCPRPDGWTKTLTASSAKDTVLPKSYAIYTSAYYTDPEFPETDGNYFTGAKFAFNATTGTWLSASADSLYWPAADDGSGTGMDFLAVATDSTVFKMSELAIWAGQDDGFLHGERNVYGVKVKVPSHGDTTEILYAAASQKCSDKTPVNLKFNHTQCCLEFRIHSNVNNVIRLNEIVVKEACTHGDILILTHPMLSMKWDTDVVEQHDKEVPKVMKNTPVKMSPDTLKYSMVLPPQPRRDIDFHFRQLAFDSTLPDSEFDPWDVIHFLPAGSDLEDRWNHFSVEARYTTTTESEKWEAGKKYIFDITIKMGEIIVKPHVVDWEEPSWNKQYVEV